MGTVEGKVAVIRGSASGIGARTAEMFVAEGARVVIAERREEKGRQRPVHSAGPRVSSGQTDVSAETHVEAIIAHAVNGFGRLDCLRHCSLPAMRRGW
jgi:NAD(P)-dependent dehydrogenase (short-subunit alcohol dehydrogenase family)